MALDMYKLIEKLFPICRSITGKGIRESFDIIKSVCPEFNVIHFKSGDQVFDWTIPKEWNINDAFIKHLASGQKYCDFKNNNLHVVNYSIFTDKIISKSELDLHLHSREDIPNAIPYITSYYNENWGFCIDHETRLQMPDGQYHVKIDSELTNGNLELMEAVFPGKTNETIFFSTYLCHPSMANNELSGPAVMAKIIEYIRGLKDRRFTYRFFLGPETIGAISYLSIRKDELQKNVSMGFVLTCLGDENRFTQVKSINGNNAADRALESALRKKKNYVSRGFLERGSDERQYGSSLINLPVTTFSRSLFREYKEYHTSLDDLKFISPNGLRDSYEVLETIIDALEFGIYIKPTNYCEPQLGKYGLYPLLGQSRENKHNSGKLFRNIIAYSNGSIDIFDLSKEIDSDLTEVLNGAKILKEKGLIKISAEPF